MVYPSTGLRIINHQWVIADNIEEVLPELVSDTDPKTVNYNGLIGLLIEVVKDQQTQINSLNERLSQLE